MFKMKYKVGIGDINYGGHMGNEVPLLLFQNVRLEFLKFYDLSELNIGDGVGTIQRESTIKYNREVFFGDELTLEISDIVIDRLSILISYSVFNSENFCVISGTTLMLGYNYSTKKVSKIPESFKEVIERVKNNKIKSIIFDLGNVLIAFKPEAFLENNFAPEDRDFAFKTIFGGQEWLDLDRGVLSYPDAVEIFGEKLPKYKDIIKDFFDKKCIDCLEKIHENIEVMKSLKKKGYPLYILSNFHQPAFDNVFRNWDFFRNFDGKVVSGHCKMLKPNLDIYHEILGKFSLKPEETLFIDDSLANIEAAKSLGINVIHLPNYNELKEKLKEIGI